MNYEMFTSGWRTCQWCMGSKVEPLREPVTWIERSNPWRGECTLCKGMGVIKTGHLGWDRPGVYQLKKEDE
jgi:hypothetical protein